MSAEKPTVKLRAVYSGIRGCYRRSLLSGTKWHCLAVGEDGKLYFRASAQPCLGESTVFRKQGPRRVTVYQVEGQGGPRTAEQVEPAVQSFDPVTEFVEPFYGSEAGLVET